jgi:hypothetical protein
MIRKFAFVIAASITLGATASMVSIPAFAAAVDEIVSACDRSGHVWMCGQRLLRLSRRREEAVLCGPG